MTTDETSPEDATAGSALAQRLKTAIRLPLAKESIHVPAWGVDVTVRAMNGVERSKVEAAAAKARKAKQSDDEVGVLTMATAVRWSVVDGETGEHLLGDDDVAPLAAGDSSALQTLWPVIDRLSRLTGRAIAAEKND